MGVPGTGGRAESVGSVVSGHHQAVSGMTAHAVTQQGTQLFQSLSLVAQLLHVEGEPIERAVGIQSQLFEPHRQFALQGKGVPFLGRQPDPVGGVCNLKTC